MLGAVSTQKVSLFHWNFPYEQVKGCFWSKNLDVLVTVTFQQLPQVHWGFYQPLNWAWLAWVRRKTHSVIWGEKHIV